MTGWSPPESRGMELMLIGVAMGPSACLYDLSSTGEWPELGSPEVGAHDFNQRTESCRVTPARPGIRRGNRGSPVCPRRGARSGE